MLKKTFISYKRQDKEIVFSIVNEIKQKTGIDCWIDLEGIESGDQFQNVIIDAIDNAEIVIFMLSKNYIAPYKDKISGKIDLKKQTFPEKEVMYALRHNKRLIPISIDGTKIADCKWLDFNCSGLDSINWMNNDQKNKLISNLIKWNNDQNEDVTDNKNKDPEDNTDSSKKNIKSYLLKKWIVLVGVVVVISILLLLNKNIVPNSKKSYDFVTKSYRIKIRKTENGDYVYTSWKRNEFGEPDIVLKNGFYDKDRHIFEFKNGTYIYLVGDKNYSSITKKGITDSLYVTNNGSILNKELLQFDK